MKAFFEVLLVICFGIVGLFVAGHFVQKSYDEHVKRCATSATSQSNACEQGRNCNKSQDACGALRISRIGYW